MTHFIPLAPEEFDELDEFLLNDVESDDVMNIDMMDGVMHAVVIGPTTMHPKV